MDFITNNLLFVTIVVFIIILIVVVIYYIATGKKEVEIVKTKPIEKIEKIPKEVEEKVEKLTYEEELDKHASEKKQEHEKKLDSGDITDIEEGIEKVEVH